MEARAGHGARGAELNSALLLPCNLPFRSVHLGLWGTLTKTRRREDEREGGGLNNVCGISAWDALYGVLWMDVWGYVCTYVCIGIV